MKANLALFAPMFFARTGYRGYAFQYDADSVGKPFIRIRTPLGEPCGYATTPRNAVRMVADVLQHQKEKGYLPSTLVYFDPNAPRGPTLLAQYFNPEKRSNQP